MNSIFDNSKIKIGFYQLITFKVLINKIYVNIICYYLINNIYIFYFI